MSAKESIEVIKNSMKEIAIADDNVCKIAKQLEMVALNLKIENARIKKIYATGLDPIIDRIGSSISDIDNIIQKVINSNRIAIQNAINEIEDELK